MITIHVKPNVWFDEKNEELISLEHEQVLKLEHSLASIQKWESIWHKPFLSTNDKTYEEIIDYIRCMTLNDDVNEKAYFFISNADIVRITEYLKNPMTATTFNAEEKKKDPLAKAVITSELIYYYMIALNIPSEYRFWHISQLITLIQVISIKNTPKKKLSNKEILSRYDKLNEERKKRLNTRG